MLREHTLLGEIDKVQIAIERLKEFEPPEGYYLAFSGGKDSIVIKDLAIKAGVKFDAHYNITTVDPPELVKFIKHYHPDVRRDRPEKTMFQLIVEKGFPPLRQARYCCERLKERGGEGRFCVTGIRWAESHRRSHRKMVGACSQGKGKRYIHPIIDWTDEEVWQYIRENELPYCSLYDEGWKRLGCVGCPNANQLKQMKRWPRIAEGYKRACIKAYERQVKLGLPTKNWKSGEEMFNWRISGRATKKGQQRITDLM